MYWYVVMYRTNIDGCLQLTHSDIGEECNTFMMNNKMIQKIRDWNEHPPVNQDSKSAHIDIQSNYYQCLNLACKGVSLNVNLQRQRKILLPSQIVLNTDVIQSIFMKNATID